MRELTTILIKLIVALVIVPLIILYLFNSILTPVLGVSINFVQALLLNVLFGKISD